MNCISNKKIALSFIISIAVLLASYVVGNTAYPLNGEQEVLNSVDIVKSMLGINPDSVPDNVLLVNVCFDKQLVPYEEDGMPVGDYAITDRRKLLAFLRAARKADNYKYIMLDVIFEKGIHSDVDRELFKQITSMKRIVIPQHADVTIEDMSLYSKAANSDYSITSEESSFTRFQFLHDSVPSMPLAAYKELTGKNITKHGIFYSSDGKLCKNALTLKLPIRISGEYINRQTHLERSYINLGADLINIDSIIPISEQIKGKFIVIGDFSNDIHTTYAGLLPGSIICLNAYYALQRGDHIINWWIVVLILLIYTVATYIIISDVSIKNHIKYKALRICISLIGIATVLYLLALVLYLGFDIVYNAVAPGYAFAIIITIKQIHILFKDEDEKNISPVHVTSDVGADKSRQLQDSLHELSETDDRRKGGKGGHDVHRQVSDSMGKGASGHKGDKHADKKAKSDGGKRPKRKRTKRNRHSH